MTYGDGSRSGREMRTSCKGFPPMVTLDIAAHEMAHGVTEYTSGLIYEHSWGGINEGLSGKAGSGLTVETAGRDGMGAGAAQQGPAAAPQSGARREERPCCPLSPLSPLSPTHPHPTLTHPNPHPDIMSQCVLDYAHDNGYPRGADFQIGSQLYQDGCSRKVWGTGRLRATPCTRAGQKAGRTAQQQPFLGRWQAPRALESTHSCAVHIVRASSPSPPVPALHDQPHRRQQPLLGLLASPL
jgi:hypothetical protein